MAPVVLRWNGRPPLPADLMQAAGAGPRGALAVLGGAGGMGPDDDAATRRLLEQVVVPVVAASGVHVVSGGTDVGVSGRLGPIWAAAATRGLLVGVVAEGTFSSGRAHLQPDHSHVVLVPGKSWGDEVEHLAQLVTLLGDGGKSATLLVNGGEISRRDVAASLAQRRAVLLAAGTGRLADELAGAPLPPGVHVLPAAWPQARQLLSHYLS